MKKFFLVFAILVLGACSKSDDNSVLDSNRNNLVGVWSIVSESSYNSSETLVNEKSLKASEECPFDKLEFLENGVLSLTEYVVESIKNPICDKRFSENIGKWILQKERRLGTNNGGEVVYYTVVELNNSNLVLERILTKYEAVMGGYPSDVTKIRIFYKK